MPANNAGVFLYAHLNDIFHYFNNLFDSETKFLKEFLSWCGFTKTINTNNGTIRTHVFVP